jgi:hypothetical protein
LDFSGNGAGEVHNIGEIWCNTLWEVRSRIIADPAGANGKCANRQQQDASNRHRWDENDTE